MDVFFNEVECQQVLSSFHSLDSNSALVLLIFISCQDFLLRSYDVTLNSNLLLVHFFFGFQLNCVFNRLIKLLVTRDWLHSNEGYLSTSNGNGNKLYGFLTKLRSEQLEKNWNFSSWVAFCYGSADLQYYPIFFGNLPDWFLFV